MRRSDTPKTSGSSPDGTTIFIIERSFRMMTLGELLMKITKGRTQVIHLYEEDFSGNDS